MLKILQLAIEFFFKTIEQTDNCSNIYLDMNMDYVQRYERLNHIQNWEYKGKGWDRWQGDKISISIYNEKPSSLKRTFDDSCKDHPNLESKKSIKLMINIHYANTQS